MLTDEWNEAKAGKIFQLVPDKTQRIHTKSKRDNDDLDAIQKHVISLNVHC